MSLREAFLPKASFSWHIVHLPCFFYVFLFRYGPHFETGNVTNITVQVGNTFYLHCKISLLQDKTVSALYRPVTLFVPFFFRPTFDNLFMAFPFTDSVLCFYASQVSWVRRKSGENGLELLTVGKQTYSGDPRYSVDFQYPNNWRLKIVSAQKIDEATYECQVGYLLLSSLHVAQQDWFDIKLIFMISFPILIFILVR